MLICRCFPNEKVSVIFHSKAVSFEHEIGPLLFSTSMTLATDKTFNQQRNVDINSQKGVNMQFITIVFEACAKHMFKINKNVTVIKSICNPKPVTITSIFLLLDVEI